MTPSRPLPSCRPRGAVLGVVMTGVVAGAMLTATPAFAVPASTTVTTKAALTSAINAGGTATIVLGGSLTTADATNDLQTVPAGSSIVLDLHGFDLKLRRIVLASNAVLKVTDSTHTGWRDPDVDLGLHVDSHAALSGSTTAVELGSGSTFRVSNAYVQASGGNQGAGIGTAAGDTTGGGHVVVDQGSIVYADGGAGGAGIGGGQGAKPVDLQVSGAIADGDGGDGGAGIGSGLNGVGAITVTTPAASQTAANNYGYASLSGTGGIGAAGVGGGENAAGGSVDLSALAGLTAVQGDTDSSLTGSPSAVGAGQGASVFGSLRVRSNATLRIPVDGRVHVPQGTTVLNEGTIDLRGGIDGAGTISNPGSIETPYSSTSQSWPSDRITGVTVNGHNYDVALDPNGGTTTGHSSVHVWSKDLGAITLDEPTSPIAGQGFLSWNTMADGSGTDGSHATLQLLTSATSSNGIAVPATIYAHYGVLPHFTASALPDATLNGAYDQPLPTDGEGITYYDVVTYDDDGNPLPGLPAGLSLDSSTGHVTGTPTAAGTYSVRFLVSGGSHDATATLNLLVAGPPSIATTSLPAATAGTGYSTRIATTGVGPITVDLSSGQLPAGLGLASDGTISGTPTAAGTAGFVVRATSRFGSVLAPLSITVAAAAATGSSGGGTSSGGSTGGSSTGGSGSSSGGSSSGGSSSGSSAGGSSSGTATGASSAPAAPTLPAIPKQTVRFGHPLQLVVPASSTLPVTWSVTGRLPKGVKLDPATGLLTGVVAEQGTFPVQLVATSSAGSASADLTIVVPRIAELLHAKPVPAVHVGASTVPLRVAGFTKGERWRVALDGKTVATGTMRKAGTLRTTVRLQATKRDVVHHLVVTGGRRITDPATRAATSITVTSVPAKRHLTVRQAKAGAAVTVVGLAGGEHVVVQAGRKVLAKGAASVLGTFTVPASALPKGTYRIAVHGAAVGRAGSATVHG